MGGAAAHFAPRPQPCLVHTSQRLEDELKQSYATKNFTVKSGLLEIEKKYRHFIYSSHDVEVGCVGERVLGAYERGVLGKESACLVSANRPLGWADGGRSQYAKQGVVDKLQQ